MSKLLANEIANYGDNAPIDLKEGLNIPAGKPIRADGNSGFSGQVLSSTGNSIAWVATFDGNYNSLSNKPTIPPAQINSDWDATSGVAVILNKPIVPPLSSVTTNAAGTASLSFNASNGEFTYTPPDLSNYATTTSLTAALSNSGNWDTAYGWGNHASAGYLTSLGDAAGVTTAKITNWDTAYGWGDHASQGYLTSYTETQDLDDVLLLGATTARDIITTGKILYSNNYANLGDLPSPSTYHGMFAHVHGEGHGYYAHAGAWVQILDTESSIAEVGDVDLSVAPQTGQVLKWDGVSWTAAPDNSGTGQGFVLSDLSVNTLTAGSPSLSYNSVSGVFTYTPPDLSNYDTAFGWGNHASAGYLTSETDPVFSASAASGILSSNIANWDTAYGWGDHSTAGYLTSYTETDPVFSASAAVGITSTNITNWDTAYGWGDHANAGYITSLPAHGITNHTDVVISTAQNDQLLKYNSTSGKWENWTSNYLTETNEIVQGNSKAEVIGSGTSDGEFKVTLQDATNSGAGEISLRQSTSGSYNITELNEGNKAANSRLVLNHLTTTNAWSEIYFKRTGSSSGTSIIRSGGGNSFEFFPVDGNVEFSISGTGTYTRLNHIVQGSLTAGGLAYPTTNGSSGDVLTSDGAGNVIWSTPTGGGGGGISLTDLSVTSNPAGSPALSYNNGTGVFTYTPPDLSSFLTSETDTLDSVTGRGNTTTNSISVGGLAVDTDVLFVDASQNQVGIGTNNPDTQLSIYDASSAAYMSIKSGTPNIPYWIGAYGGSNGGFFIERGDNNNNILTVDQSDNVFLYGAGALRLQTTNIGVTVSGSATATSFIKTGGTSSQYLMADGSVTTGGGGGGGANVTISDTIPPGSPTAGDLWWESDTGRLKIYYQDVDSSQWVDTNPPLAATGGGGGGGITLANLSVTTNPAGSPALSYNNGTGVFTYTPPDLSGYLTSLGDAAGVTTAKINNWDTSYSWGDHSSAGYLTSLGDAIQDADFTSNGLMKRTGAGSYTSVTDNSSNWDTAYGWGDHSTAGYSTFSGSYIDLSNKPTIPTATSQLTNDTGFITSVPPGRVYLLDDQSISSWGTSYTLTGIPTGTGETGSPYKRITILFDGVAIANPGSGQIRIRVGTSNNGIDNQYYTSASTDGTGNTYTADDCFIIGKTVSRGAGPQLTGVITLDRHGGGVGASFGTIIESHTILEHASGSPGNNSVYSGSGLKSVFQADNFDRIEFSVENSQTGSNLTGSFSFGNVSVYYEF